MSRCEINAAVLVFWFVGVGVGFVVVGVGVLPDFVGEGVGVGVGVLVGVGVEVGVGLSSVTEALTKVEVSLAVPKYCVSVDTALVLKSQYEILPPVVLSQVATHSQRIAESPFVLFNSELFVTILISDGSLLVEELTKSAADEG